MLTCEKICISIYFFLFSTRILIKPQKSIKHQITCQLFSLKMQTFRTFYLQNVMKYENLQTGPRDVRG